MITVLAISMILPYFLTFFLANKNRFVSTTYLFLFIGKSQILIIVPIILGASSLSENLEYYYLLLSCYYLLLLPLIYLMFKVIKKGQSNIVDISQPKKYGSSIIVSILAFMCFFILLENSNYLFLTDPRKGYQYHRVGVGIFWAFYITFISVIFYFNCIRRRISIMKIIIFMFLFYLTGSKQLVLSLMITSFIVFSLQRDRIDLKLIFFTMVSGVLLFLVLFDQFGASESFIIRITNYFDFLKNASRVFDDYNNSALDFQFGEIWLSSFWSYVPRLIYTEKPYVYGATYILEMYYPGMAATGHTPSFGPLTTQFVDFGWFAPLWLIFTDWDTLIKFLTLILIMRGRILEQSRPIQVIALYGLSPAFGFHIPTAISLVGAIFVITGFYTYYRRGM